MEPARRVARSASRYEYNVVGNLVHGTRSITTRLRRGAPEREVEADNLTGARHGLDSLTTKYQYDTVEQVTRIDLPYKASNPTDKAAIYRRYDKNGNVIAATAPIPTVGISDETLLWDVIPENMTTAVEYYDTGLPLTIKDHVNAPVTYHYNADAARFGRIGYVLDGKPFVVVKAQVPSSFARTLKKMEMDGMNAIFVNPDQMTALNRVARIEQHLSVPWVRR